MAAAVESMFSVKETPWHKLGVVLNEAPTIAQAIIQAGLNWTVLEEPVYTMAGQSLSEHSKRFYRSTDGKTLGVVGPKTYPLQNAEAFDFFQPFVDAKECSLETAGSLCEGQKVWVMAKMNRDNCVISQGDEVAKFILLSNSHDGTTAIRVGFTPIRVVCANTLRMAHGDKASKLIRVRHSKNVKENLEAIRDIMNVANAEFEATAEQYRLLASKQLHQSDLRKYVKIVFAMEEEVGGLPKSTRSKNILENIVKLFESGMGNSLPGTRGSYWAAYNAVTQYLSYERGNTADTRINGLWFGEGNRINGLALETALNLAV